MLPGQTEKTEVAKAEKIHQQTNFSDQNFWASIVDLSFGKRFFCASVLIGSLLGSTEFSGFKKSELQILEIQNYGL